MATRGRVDVCSCDTCTRVCDVCACHACVCVTRVRDINMWLRASI